MSHLLSKYTAPDATGRTQHVTPASAGWNYVGFSAYQLPAEATLSLRDDNNEMCVVMVGGIASITAGEQTFDHVGHRKCPFEKQNGQYVCPHSLYAPCKTHVSITANTDCEIAVCYAPDFSADGSADAFPVRLIDPDTLICENRGKGQNQRYVQNILPETDTSAHSLLVVEVFTNEGNTSSYPSHKHDQDNLPHESFLEETYYHRINPPQGFALQRIYTDDRSLDETMAVYDKDVVMVPKGYHPVATIAGYDNYYLNVMAGPTRIWKFNNESDHDWITGDDYPKS